MRRPPPPEGALPSQLAFDNIDRFGTLGALFSIKADLVALGKSLKSSALDGRMMDKDVIVIFTSNEAKAFAVTEPLHCSLWHSFYLLICNLKSQKISIKKATKLKVFVASYERKNF